MRRLLLIAMLCFLPTFLSAQEITVPVHVDVEGLEPGISKITYAEFVAKFGKPDKYEKYESEFGMTEIYDIGGNHFHCEENGVLYNFRVKDNSLRVLTTYIKGGIRVGDEFNKLNFLKPKLVKTYPDGLSQYSIFEDISDDKLVIFVEGGKIVSMIYTYPV